MKLMDELLQNSIQLTEDYYKLLKKIPAMHETFFKKRKFFLPIFSKQLYFVIKSNYLLIYDERSSQIAYDYYNELEVRNIQKDKFAGPHSKLTPKKVIMLEHCTISGGKSFSGPLLHIKVKKGKNMVLLCNSEQQRDIWLKYLQRAMMTATSEDFQIIKFLGKGSFGEVNLAIYKPTGMKVALKRAYVESTSILQHILEERSIFEKVSGHPFIVNLCYAFREGRTLYYAQQYCPGGDLYSKLQRKGKFPEVVAQFYGAEILLALIHLHSHNILHRDLKPENVLLDDQDHACLTDFGLSKFLCKNVDNN